ncbi:hypothetical protein [Yinghuangia soli]|uniref:Uncharacterized protein n=1 Tax=Yinghuangia soli TaxID=2908204 RepID=A0AA41PVY7_9ACTN|nr:hypothetical protein [Yinghuangia soli]MCF2526340.1 hypothetical protein [Yinghuangia soli]
MDAATPSMAPEPPVVGTIVHTIYGPQQVMDVSDVGQAEMTLWLRPERGGLEWTVSLAGYPSVLATRRRESTS